MKNIILAAIAAIAIFSFNTASAQVGGNGGVSVTIPTKNGGGVTIYGNVGNGTGGGVVYYPPQQGQGVPCQNCPQQGGQFPQQGGGMQMPTPQPGVSFMVPAWSTVSETTMWYGNKKVAYYQIPYGGYLIYVQKNSGSTTKLSALSRGQNAFITINGTEIMQATNSSQAQPVFVGV
jgi:hypothetical protein